MKRFFTIKSLRLHDIVGKVFSNNIVVGENASFRQCFVLFHSQDLPLSGIYSFPNKPWFLRVCDTNLLKTLWEKEKLLVTSNFCFSHIVSYLSKNFVPVSSNCRLQTLSVWKSLKFVVWERVKMKICSLLTQTLNCFFLKSKLFFVRSMLHMCTHT